MNRLVLQILFLQSFLHIEVSLPFALDSLLLVVPDNASVHGLYKSQIRCLVAWEFTDRFILLLRKVNKGDNADCGRTGRC